MEKPVRKVKLASFFPVKATTRNFNHMVIWAAAVDKSGSVSEHQSPFRKPLILLQQGLTVCPTRLLM